MPLSLLIATRDRPNELRRCLASIASQRGVEAEVIVLDDASTPPIDAGVLEAGPYPLRVLRAEARMGVAAGRNRLMREARGEALVVLDDDAFLVDDEALLRISAALEAYPEAGLFALKIRDFRYGVERWLTPHPRRVRGEDLLEHSHRVSYFLGGAHVIRRDVFEACGPYPEAFVYGNEELDLSFRALEHGFEIRFLAEVEVRHQPPPDEPVGAGEFNTRLYHHTRSRLLLAYAHLPGFRGLVYGVGWLGIYGQRAVRHGALRAWGAAIRDAWRMRGGMQRRPIGPKTLAYLRAHFGRLWV